MTNPKDDKRARMRKRRRKRTKPVLCVFFILIAIAMTCGIAGVIYIASLGENLPTLTKDDFVYAQTSYVYDNEGNLLTELAGAEDRTVVELKDIPASLIDCLLATEDRRFYEHNGIDTRSLGRAIWVNVKDTLRNRELTFSQGASTITMQLVSCVLKTTTQTDLVAKVQEMMVATELEKEYDKDEILYYYLNVVYMGPGIYGMQAAASYYFNKDVSEISLAEAALLVGLIRNPSYYSPFDEPENALLVRNTVLNNVAEYKPALYADSAVNAKDTEVVVALEKDNGISYAYGWYIDSVIEEAENVLEAQGLDPSLVYTGGLHIYTELDVSLQQIMENVYADQDNFPTSPTTDWVECASVLMEPTGALVAMIGGREYTTTRGYNRATDLIRSPGSTIKPLVVYAPAVQEGYGSGYVIDDSPLTIGDWSPKNDDGGYLGRITMRTALARSRNVCAVKLLREIGVETGYNYVQKMGLDLDEGDRYNAAIALGGLTYGVSPEKMAGGFSTLSNGGIYTEPYTIREIKDGQGNVVYSATPVRTEVFSEAAAYIVSSMLSSVITSGTGGNAAISGWQVCGKTGTNSTPSAKDDPDFAGINGVKDAWFCGYTPALTCTVWMGYDDKRDDNDVLQYMQSIYGGNYPARLFRTIMSQALAEYEDVDHYFDEPAGVSHVAIDTKTGFLPSSSTPSGYISTELYLAGTAPGEVSSGWKYVTICVESGLLARSGCTNTISESRLVYSAENNSSYSPDSSLFAPTTYCNLHNDNASGWWGPGIGNEDDENDDGGGSSSGGGSSGGSTSGGGEQTMDSPYGVDYTTNYKSVTVKWNSTVTGEDIVYVVERTDGEQTDRYMVYDRTFTDGDVEEDKSYTYRVYIYNVDSGEISGWSESVKVRM